LDNIFFSVIIPLYNKENYIKECIESVLVQSYQDFEIIVIDDGSTDESISVVESFDDERISLTRQENSGVSSARNKGIELSKNEFIAFLDADDWYEKDYLSTISGLIRAFPECDAFSSAYNKHFDSSVKSSGTPKSIPPYTESFVVSDFYGEWNESAFFFTSSIVVRLEYFNSNKLKFPVDENMGEDQEIWFHLAEHGKICYTKKIISNYRIGSTNSLTLNNNLTIELPFVSRLKLRVAKDEQAGIDVSERRKFINRYELERAVNNAKSGNKVVALNLLFRNASIKQSKLVLQGVVGILLPVLFINILRKIYGRII
jgi:glycosyltransferase involved in cell wall biosynthesis